MKTYKEISFYKIDWIFSHFLKQVKKKWKEYSLGYHCLVMMSNTDIHSPVSEMFQQKFS